MSIIITMHKHVHFSQAVSVPIPLQPPPHTTLIQQVLQDAQLTSSHTTEISATSFCWQNFIIQNPSSGKSGFRIKKETKNAL